MNCQYFTPEWAAQALVDRYFPDLSPSDLVIEPSCGPGAFLKAIPENVPAIGVELDPLLARQAEANTGRKIITGDFSLVQLPDCTAIIGNPPFELAIVEKFLHRAALLLPEMGRAGFLLPAYAFQTHGRVVSWLDRWSMRADIVPRRLFPNLSKPLVFATFTRNARREMVGFALFPETVDVEKFAARTKELLTDGAPRKGVWRAVVDDIMTRLGGEAHLSAIYDAIEPRRPTQTEWWKQKVRQVLQFHYQPLGGGVWRAA